MTAAVNDDGELLELARRKDWTSLWYKVRRMSVVGAVNAIRLFRDWEPDSDADRAIFRRLVVASPMMVARATRSSVVVLPGPTSYHLQSSPDSSHIAVLLSSDPNSQAIQVYALPNGKRVADVCVEGAVPFNVDRVFRHLGGAIVHLEWSYPVSNGQEERDPHQRTWRLVRHTIPNGEREILFDGITTYRLDLDTIPGGFVVAGARNRIWIGGATGPIREHRCAALEDESFELGATEGSTGRLAITREWGKELVLLDDNCNVIARRNVAEDGCVNRVWFLGPETLITKCTNRALSSWRIVDGAFLNQARLYMDSAPFYGDEYSNSNATMISSLGAIVFSVPDGGTPYWYDVPALSRLPALLNDAFPRWVSPDGTYVVLAERELRVHDLRVLELVRLITTPVTQVRAVDIEHVIRGERNLPAAVQTIAELLRVLI